MNIGMLWFDNDPKRDLNSKVTDAVEYYRKKYGHKPTICFVNPSMADKKEFQAGDVAVKTSDTILPHHLWIGSQDPA